MIRSILRDAAVANLALREAQGAPSQLSAELAVGLACGFACVERAPLAAEDVTFPASYDSMPAGCARERWLSHRAAQ